MHELIEHIAGLAAKVEACVCVGVGSVALADELSALRPARLILLEGNEEAAAQIAAQMPRWPAAELHTAVVAPNAGVVTWYTHNLPSFDGPVDAAPLTRFFPRLARTGETRRDAVGFGDWLASLNVRHAEAGSVNVLVLVLPGQEVALLRSMSPQLLECFDAVVAQGCSDIAYADDSTLPAMLRFLEDRGFLSGEVLSQRLLWPTVVARLDRPRWNAAKLQRRVHELDAVITEQQASHAEKVEALSQALRLAEARLAQLESLQRDAAEARSAAEQQAMERAVQFQQLAEAKDVAERLAQDRLAQLDAITHAMSAAEVRTTELERHVNQIAEAKLAAEQFARDKIQQLDALSRAIELANKESADYQAHLRQLAAEKAEAERLAQERLVQLEVICAAKAAAEAEAEARGGQLQRLTQLLEASESLAQERRAELDVLRSERLVADAGAAESSARVEHLSAECRDLQGKLVSVRDELAQARAAYQGAEELALEFGRKLKESMERRDASASEVAALQQQLEQARGQLDDERAAARRQADETQAQRLCIAQLEAELRDNRRALNLAVRTQALREQDLRELQERYAAIQLEQDASQELVTRLAERLTVAQRYFEQLAAESSSIAPSIQVAASAEGITRSVRSRKPAKVEAIASSQTTRPVAQAPAGLYVPTPAGSADDAAAPAHPSATTPARRRRAKKAAAPTTG
jgi:hypothetical protein